MEKRNTLHTQLKYKHNLLALCKLDSIVTGDRA